MEININEITFLIIGSVVGVLIGASGVPLVIGAITLMAGIFIGYIACELNILDKLTLALRRK